ncbi:MAG: MFS transporter [Chloroflexi bacterium]|nr:MFS transporter [Chloroflexota bacterium]
MKSVSRLHLVGYFVFITLGINVALLGPSLQTLSLRTGAAIPELGYIFAAMSVGYLASAPVIGSLKSNASLRPLLSATGLILVSLLLFVGATSLWQALFAAFLLGFGQASTQVGFITLIGTSLSTERNASGQLNRINAFYGVGALVGPLLVAVSYRWLGNALPAFWVAIVLDAVMLVVGLLMPLPRTAATSADSSVAEKGKSDLALLRVPAMIALMSMMAVYVGTEVSFSSWATEYTRLGAKVDVAAASLASSIFFCGLALSRYFATLLLARTTPLRALLFMLMVAAVGVGVMLLPGGFLPAMLLGAALVGVGYGPVYPTLVSTAIARFPHAARSVSSMVTSAGSIGAITMPALTGIIIAQPAGLSIAWGGQLAMIGVMLVLLLGMRRTLLAAAE